MIFITNLITTGHAVKKEFFWIKPLSYVIMKTGGIMSDVSRIYGKIQFVESFPDFKVQVVDSFADLHVRKVDSFPDNPGEWQIVDSFPDYKIQIVDSFPDFTIKYVDSFPGVQ